MRISVRKGDPGYHPLAFQCNVYFNGEKINNCFTADEEMGEVHCYETDENGTCLLSEDMTEYREITLYGSVKIVFPDDFKSADFYK